MWLYWTKEQHSADLRVLEHNTRRKACVVWRICSLMTEVERGPFSILGFSIYTHTP